MPDIVANGRKPDVRACGACHRAEGTGGPENARLAGLPVSYFVQQIADFKSGARKMSGPDRPSISLMMRSVKGMTDAEVLAAAQYVSALKPKRNIKVVEADTIPKTGGAGTTLACGICHGPALTGVGPIPGIAGRSPTYIVRQLYEFKTGGRSEGASALMKQAVEKLSPEDIIALAAYVGSLEP